MIETQNGRSKVCFIGMDVGNHMNRYWKIVRKEPFTKYPIMNGQKKAAIEEKFTSPRKQELVPSHIRLNSTALRCLFNCLPVFM